MNKEELAVLEQVLSFANMGATITGRDMNTQLWIDFYGEFGNSRYVVTSGMGHLLVQTNDLGKAWEAWKEQEE